MEADLTTLAAGGAGTASVAAVFGWQWWRMMKDDKQSQHLHTQANAFSNTLLKESAALKKENKELREACAKAERVALDAERKQLKAENDISLLKSQMVTVLAKFEELKAENDCLCRENKELKNPAPQKLGGKMEWK